MNLPARVLFRSDYCTAMLLIGNEYIDLSGKKSEAKRFGLLPKDEFHITIIGSETGEGILNYLDILERSEKNKIVENLQNLCESFPWKISLIDEYYYVKKYYNDNSDVGAKQFKIEKRESIIQIVKISKFSLFYKKLNLMVNQNFETPVPHITLFSNSTNEEKKLRGIGIYSKRQFTNLKPLKI